MAKASQTKVIVDVTKALRKLNRLEKDLEKEGALSAHDLGDMGKQYARSIAPYYSGDTFRNIVLKRGKTTTEAIVQAQNPTYSDGHKRGARSTKYFTRGRFNLVKWMHESPRAQSHIHSGKPKFMDAAYAYLMKKAPELFRERLDKLIVKTNNR